VAGSTTVDRGKGPVAQADASAPLLHGIDIGDIAGRQSDAESLDAHTVVISQTLNALAFSDDFALTNKQGVTVRMDAAGNTRSERSGDAAKGLSGADPKVERRVSQVGDGYRVDYVIRNAGVDERGIPGVRIASVEGLLIETDQFGRYHLEGVAGGPWERGRNFILKVDPATLPPGSVFTSDNPLVRRITPGIPVRFDFGIKLPSGLIEGGEQTVEMELGAVMFDAGSAVLRSQYAPVIDKIAEQVRQHGGGQVVIAANGETQALAYDRAKAVRAALLEKLTPEQAKALSVDLRADVEDPDSSLLTLGESPVLGTVLFDTDKATIKPEYAPLIDKLAADIESRKGGAIAVVGHADRRGSDSYNTELGLRRAKAVFEAIAAKLSPEARGKLRVDISDKPTAPVGIRGQ
jgi:outer membrane protein OmpA-like peptidoglycan-associated protein